MMNSMNNPKKIKKKKKVNFFKYFYYLNIKVYLNKIINLNI